MPGSVTDSGSAACCRKEGWAASSSTERQGSPAFQPARWNLRSPRRALRSPQSASSALLPGSPPALLPVGPK